MEDGTPARGAGVVATADVDVAAPHVQQRIPQGSAKDPLCQPGDIEPPKLAGVSVPPLPAGQRPNFIVIVTDDQGWDDIGLHNPKYVQTPKLDAFLRRSMRFDNFYVAPQCAQTRASLMTGRHHMRTSTMLVHGGYDYIASGEATLAHVMDAANYSTGHFGKWHTQSVLGYSTSNSGFEESWYCDSLIEDETFIHNGEYVKTRGQSEEVLLDKLLDYLRGRQADRRPFLAYYAPLLIHSKPVRGEGGSPTGPPFTRYYPEHYAARFKHPRYNGISQENIDVRLPGGTRDRQGEAFAPAWAMLAYLDDNLGHLFDFLRSSPLHQNTYVIITSDNGVEMLEGAVRTDQKLLRMPSRMRGCKHEVLEGGTRGFLGVAGPGVPAGVIDSTMLQAVDIMPTITQLANLGADADSVRRATRLSRSSYRRAAAAAAAAAAALKTTPEGGADINGGLEEANPYVPKISLRPWDGLSFAHLLRAALPSEADGATRPRARAEEPAQGGTAPPASAPQSPVNGADITPHGNSLNGGEGAPGWDARRGNSTASPYRGDALATRQQRDRYVFLINRRCWDPDTVPDLTEDRRVSKSQPMLNFDNGGVFQQRSQRYGWASKSGFIACIAVRHRQYKLVGQTGKVYRLADGNHIESSCNEVTGSHATQLRGRMEAAARDWWQSLLREPHSFSKPVFYLGWGGTAASQVPAEGAYMRTPGRVRLLEAGASGFSTPGDKLCWQLVVIVPGTYAVTVRYQSSALTQFRLSVGAHAAIKSGRAPSISTRLQPQSKAGLAPFGSLMLNVTDSAAGEACLELLASAAQPGRPALVTLTGLRFVHTGLRRLELDAGSPTPLPAATAAAANTWVQAQVEDDGESQVD